MLNLKQIVYIIMLLLDSWNIKLRLRWVWISKPNKPKVILFFGSLRLHKIDRKMSVNIALDDGNTSKISTQSLSLWHLYISHKKISSSPFNWIPVPFIVKNIKVHLTQVSDLLLKSFHYVIEKKNSRKKYIFTIY